MAIYKDNDEGTTQMQPSQDIKEWTEKDYIQNIRWIAGMYNRAVYTPIARNTAVTANDKFNSWIDNYNLNEAYYWGVQAIEDFQSLTVDESNKPLAISMRRDRDIFQIINKVVGTGMQPLKQLPKMISAFSKNPNTISKRMFLKDIAKLMIDQKNFFEMMQATSGFELKPFGDLDLNDEAEVETYFTNYKEGLERSYIALAKDICYRNSYVSVLEKGLLHASIGGINVVRIDVENGMVYWRIVPPQFAIWDNYNSDPMHRYDRFAGEVKQYTLTELFSRYEFTEEEKKDLKAIAQAPQSWLDYNTMYNGVSFSWYDQSANSIPMVTVVECQWRSLNYMDGVEKPYEVIRQGVLIGNKYLREFGIAKNCPEDTRNKSKLRMRYVAVSPAMLSGGNLSIVDLLRTYQSEKNAIKTKLFQLIANAKGKRYVVYADRLPAGMGTPDFLSQLTQAGVAVLTGTQIDDNSNDKNESLVQTIDMTLDQNVFGLINIMADIRRNMNDIVALNQTALGNTDNYMSKEQLMQNVDSAKLGMDFFYSAYNEFVKNLLEVSANMAKLCIKENEEDYTLIVGDGMYEMLSAEVAEKLVFEDMDLVLSISDYLTEQDKNFYKQYFIQKASASANPLDDLMVLGIDKFSSKTEMINYITYMTAKKIEMQNAEREAAMAQQQQAVEAQAGAQVDSTAIGAETALEKEAMKTERDIALAEMKNQG